MNKIVMVLAHKQDRGNAGVQPRAVYGVLHQADGNFLLSVFIVRLARTNAVNSN